MGGAGTKRVESLCNIAVALSALLGEVDQGVSIARWGGVSSVVVRFPSCWYQGRASVTVLWPVVVGSTVYCQVVGTGSGLCRVSGCRLGGRVWSVFTKSWSRRGPGCGLGGRVGSICTGSESRRVSGCRLGGRTGSVWHTGGRASVCYVVVGVTGMWFAKVEHIAQRSASNVRWEWLKAKCAWQIFACGRSACMAEKTNVPRVECRARAAGIVASPG